MCVRNRLALLTALALAATPASPAAGPPLSRTRAGAFRLRPTTAASSPTLG